MITKEKVLEEIKRTAKENGGVPLGTSRFEKETGIKPHEWGKYWARIGDAQKEAGLSPNQRQGAYEDAFIFDQIIKLIRKLGKFPTVREFILEKNNNPEFPSAGGALKRLGGQEQIASKIIEYCKDKEGHEDIVELCTAIVGDSKNSESEETDGEQVIIGSVYLFKHGKYYKIGKSNDTVRRGNELRIQLPENLDLIHEIKTDDPSGIEAYWHKRFGLKRMNGEWFDLNSSDVKAFKRWKRIC
ncbi:MAG TPA: GIY-YIG nuclease family protein [Candidatus Paceibacterota bacterium]|nr:GIY-YIG nuclease family protein [Candidatus Paceibacterota bacterium]